MNSESCSKCFLALLCLNSKETWRGVLLDTSPLQRRLDNFSVYECNGCRKIAVLTRRADIFNNGHFEFIDVRLPPLAKGCLLLRNPTTCIKCAQEKRKHGIY